ncbi:anion permease [Streptomyces sp. NPDC003442]
MDHITFLVAVVIVTALAFTPGMIFAGLVGAVWVGAGSHGVHFDKVVEKVLIPAVASPVVAGVAALLAAYLAYRLTDRARKKSVTKGFRAGQIASASLVSLAHGTNDAQKTMGVITLTLISTGALGHDAGPPLWVIASAGLGRRLAEVRWGVAGRMVIAWMVTLPAAALVGGVSASVVTNGGNIGAVVVALIGAALAGGIVLLSRRNPVDAKNVNDAHEVTIRNEPPAKVGTAA